MKQNKEIERLRQWINDLQSGMYVNCVYCGHRYGPKETTPVSMTDALKAHIEQCPEHPMSKLKLELNTLRAELSTAKQELEEAKKTISVRITQMGPDCKALGAFGLGSMASGQGEIIIDFVGIQAETELTDDQKKQTLFGAVMHELHHAMSEFMGLPLGDPDGMCGGVDGPQEMVVVPLEEHEAIVKSLESQLASAKEGLAKNVKALKAARLALVSINAKSCDVGFAIAGDTLARITAIIEGRE